MNFLRKFFKPEPITVHFATGGLSHFLLHLGNSVRHARETGRTVVVVSEHHRPLARQSMDSIFKLSDPVRPLSEFLEKSGRHDVPSFSPRFYPLTAEDRKGLYLVESRQMQASVTGWVPEEAAESVAFTTGHYRPRSANAIQAASKPMENRLASQQASLESLAIRGRFADAIAKRARELTGPFLGVHFRNSDRLSNLDKAVAAVQETIQKTGISDIYWCTDDRASIDEARNRLPKARLFSSQPFEIGLKKNLHNGLRGEDSFSHLENTFADLFTLSVADEFIPSAGGWAQLVPILRGNRNVRTHFFGLKDF